MFSSDLNDDHLTLLKNIREKGISTIKTKYGIDETRLRIYLHYQPSFYHLHVHFTFLQHDAPGIFCERSHLLDTVINNIELLSNYYKKATLLHILKEGETLFEKNQNFQTKKFKLNE